MDKDSIITNNKNFSLEIKNNKLILFIRDSEPFSFENALDNAYKQWLEEGKPQDELETLIKKQDSKYFIYKPLEVHTENANKDVAQESKNDDTESKESQKESSKRDEESKQNDKESNRKTIHIQDELSFKNCVFNGEVYFKYIAFTSQDSKESTQPLRLDFQHCEFHKRVYFTNCEFNGNVFFNHAKFYKYTDFHESIFNGVVSFYNAEFKFAPNFSTCVFQNLQATNFINVKIESLDFDKVKQFIKEYRIDGTYQNKLNSLKQQYSQDTNEYKTQKQTLDNTHKIRYASNARDSFRTIKNALITNNNLLDASTWHKLELYAKEHEIDLKAPTKFSKEWIERIQLCFYRRTSAHHTDLLESIKSLLIVIGIFGVLSCVVIVGFSLYCGFWDCNPHILTKCYDKYIKCFLLNHYCWATIINLALFIIFIGIFIVTILYQNVRKYSFYFFCAITLVLFIASPKYLVPPIEIFTDKRMLLDPLSVVGGVYSILFGFMLYSLIKTARKNSIIPN